ncbi:hypothetical protein CYMTET_24345 [Cymbomonas tetramitiformis]|uniref:Uncharacterized protein n=1 Tax=Cymbomonas tetramitiformis TaxID=36881 RepID=A0AAE0FWH8_9CHLO|nr:hypothetical protein CYMTET_24345 [Cymbomonas tetramitiformis]
MASAADISIRGAEVSEAMAEPARSGASGCGVAERLLFAAEAWGKMEPEATAATAATALSREDFVTGDEDRAMATVTRFAATAFFFGGSTK